MNSLKKGEGVPLLNFVGGTGTPLLNFEGDPGVQLSNFEGGLGSRVPGSRGPGSWGPGPTFTPCLKQLNWEVINAFLDICSFLRLSVSFDWMLSSAR